MRALGSAEDDQVLLEGNSLLHGSREFVGNTVEKVSGMSYAAELDGMRSLARYGVTSEGKSCTQPMCHPKKHRGAILGQSHPSRQGLPMQTVE